MLVELSADLFSKDDDTSACTLHSAGGFLYPGSIRVEGTTARVSALRNDGTETCVEATSDFRIVVPTARALWRQGHVGVLTSGGLVILQIVR